MRYDEERMRPLVLEWQRSRDPRLFAEIVEGSLELLTCLIRKSQRGLYDLDELTNECVLKLYRALPHYTPSWGSSFTFCVISINRFLWNYREKVNNFYRRHQLWPDWSEINQSQSAPALAPNEQYTEFWQAIESMPLHWPEPIEQRILDHILSFQDAGGPHSRQPLPRDPHWLKSLRKEYGLKRREIQYHYNRVVADLRQLLT